MWNIWEWLFDGWSNTTRITKGPFPGPFFVVAPQRLARGNEAPGSSLIDNAANPPLRFAVLPWWKHSYDLYSEE